MVELFWDEIFKLRVNDRIYLWMKAEKVEVGSRLRINSVVLNPKPIPGEKRKKKQKKKRLSMMMPLTEKVIRRAPSNQIIPSTPISTIKLFS